MLNFYMDNVRTYAPCLLWRTCKHRAEDCGYRSQPSHWPLKGPGIHGLMEFPFPRLSQSWSVWPVCLTEVTRHFSDQVLKDRSFSLGHSCTCRLPFSPESWAFEGCKLPHCQPPLERELKPPSNSERGTSTCCQPCG